MMQKVKAFFNIFFKSLLPNPLYYRKLLNTRFLFSFKYFISLIFFLNLILIGNLLIRYSPLKINYWLNQINLNLSQFPSDLNIVIDKGFLISSYDRPYFFWLKDNKNRLRLIFVIDESAVPEKINQYQSMALLTKTDLVIKKKQEIHKIPLSSFEQIIINKQIVNVFAQKISFFKKILYPIYFLVFILLIIIILTSSFFINLIYLSLASMVAFLFLKLKPLKPEKKYHFKKIFQISLHASTLPLLIDYLMFNFPPFLPIKVRLPINPFPFPLLFLFLLTTFIFFGAYEAYYNDHLQTHHHSRRKN